MSRYDKAHAVRVMSTVGKAVAGLDDVAGRGLSLAHNHSRA